MEIKAFTLYPDFAITPGESEGLSKWKLRCLQEEKINMIRQEIEGSKPIKTMIKYLISLPQEEALHAGHPVGQAGVYAQNLNPYVYFGT